jgi:hypothetical protein
VVDVVEKSFLDPSVFFPIVHCMRLVAGATVHHLVCCLVGHLVVRAIVVVPTVHIHPFTTVTLSVHATFPFYPF